MSEVIAPPIRPIRSIWDVMVSYEEPKVKSVYAEFGGVMMYITDSGGIGIIKI